MPTKPHLMNAAAILVSLAGCKSAESKASPPERDSASQKSAQSETCEAGYERRDGACVDIDECGGVATPCGPLPDAKCRNTAGSYECTCAAGYVGGGPGGFGCSPPIARFLRGLVCAVTDAETVACWDVRKGLAKEATPPSLQRLHGVVALESGDLSTGCALLRDGTVQCWGENDQGELGDGTRESRADPAPVPGLKSAIGLSVSSTGGCAVLRYGTVSCWGSNEDGALGRGTIGGIGLAESVKALTSAVAVTRVGYRTCALLRDGRAQCWGFRPLGAHEPANASTPREVPGVERALQLAFDGHTCFLRDDRTVWCWGSNSYGELGDGTQVDATEPRKARTDQVWWLGAGSEETRAIRNGQVQRWGRDHLAHSGMEQQGYNAAEAESTLSPVPVRGTESVRAMDETLRYLYLATGAIAYASDELEYSFSLSSR